MTRLRAILVLLTLVQLGCAGYVHFGEASSDSSRARIFRRVAVVSHLADFNTVFSNEFAKEVVSAFSKHGVEAHVTIVSPLNLDPGAQVEQIMSFAPDAVLVVRQTKGAVEYDEHGKTGEAGWFVARLHEDINLEKAIWAAEFSVSISDMFNSPRKTGRRAAQKLVDELAKAGFVSAEI